MSKSKISSRFNSLNKPSECFSDRGMARALMPGFVNSDEERTKAGFAREKCAQEFADRWRRKLWSEHFDHPDPVHNAPVRV
jgi:hypothetical protein